MPPTVKKSGLMAKYGANLDKAVKTHAGDETNFGFQRLPAGINNGIAKLVECTFGVVDQGKTNAGEYYFRAAGVVVEPKLAPDGTPVAGMQTSIMEMVCDTTSAAGAVTTQEEHVERILNEMRKLGADTSNATGADLESLAAALKEAGPYFKFSTSLGKTQLENGKPKVNPATGKPYEPRVFENWNGTRGLESWTPSDDDGAVVDQTGDAAAGGGDTQYSDQDDLDSLAKRADGGEDAAIDRLTELAHNAGMDDDAIREAGETWADVVAAMSGGMTGGEGETAAAEEEWEPKKEEVYKYQPVDAKGSPLKDARTKKAIKPVDVEVTAVNKAKRTVDVKSLTDKKPVRGVAWDALVRD